MKKEQTLEQKFPTAQARKKADEAIDSLPHDAPMYVYTDTWLAAYKAAGGR